MSIKNRIKGIRQTTNYEIGKTKLEFGSNQIHYEIETVKVEKIEEVHVGRSEVEVLVSAQQMGSFVSNDDNQVKLIEELIEEKNKFTELLQQIEEKKKKLAKALAYGMKKKLEDKDGKP